MRASLLRRLSIAAVIAASVPAACSATNSARSSGSTGGSGAGGGGGATSASNAINASATTASGLVGGATTSGGGGAGTGGTLAYAHTNTTLFQLDPSQTPLAITEIGDFACLGGSGEDESMTDLAVSSTGDLWSVSEHYIYHLQLPTNGPGMVQCLTQAPLANTSSGDVYYGLTFAPAGVLDPAKEVLVAADTAGNLSSVTPTGALTLWSNFGTVPPNDGHGHTYLYPGGAWELSGDIVFLANGGNPVGFATVRDCPSPPGSSGCDPTDSLMEIVLPADGGPPTMQLRGQIAKSPTCNDTANTNYGSLYGIFAYQGNVLGFSHQGYVVTIDNTDATACLALSTSNDAWAGAAITTVAPIIVTN